jgi:rod shape-determining protein MreD
MNSAEAAKAAVLLFVAAIVQVSIVSSMTLLGGRPDLLLITLVLVALLRGAITGAVGGFAAGLVVDTANLETLGVTSATARRPGVTARTRRSSRSASRRSCTRSPRSYSISCSVSTRRRA